MKPTVAILSCTSCTGCVISLLDLHEDLLHVLDMVDIVFGTTIMDVKELPKCDIAIINGCVANEMDVRHAKFAREKAGKIVALGSCACYGGIPGLRNLYQKESMMDLIYKKLLRGAQESIPSSVVPPLLPQVMPVDKMIKVDYRIPGCPPLPEHIAKYLPEIIAGKPLKIPSRNMCAECDRKQDRMLVPGKEILSFKIHHLHEVDLSSHTCFLENGIVCIGYATREGCGGRCVKNNIPCRGCMGPLEKEPDQGAAMISGLASILPIGILLEQEDLTGISYRYTLPHSIFPAKINFKEEEE